MRSNRYAVTTIAVRRGAATFIVADTQGGAVTDRDGGDTGDEHVCEACEESFETETALERHLHESGLVD